MGMTHVAHIDGGFTAWAKQGAPAATYEQHKAHRHAQTWMSRKFMRNLSLALMIEALVAMKFEAILFDCDAVLVGRAPMTKQMRRDMREARG